MQLEGGLSFSYHCHSKVHIETANEQRHKFTSVWQRLQPPVWEWTTTNRGNERDMCWPNYMTYNTIVTLWSATVYMRENCRQPSNVVWKCKLFKCVCVWKYRGSIKHNQSTSCLHWQPPVNGHMIFIYRRVSKAVIKRPCESSMNDNSKHLFIFGMSFVWDLYMRFYISVGFSSINKG